MQIPRKTWNIMALLQEDDVKKLQGLSEKTVLEKFKSEGYNELPSSKKRSLFHIAIEVFKEPMFFLLIACGVIYLLVGEAADAVMLMGFVIVMICITIYQEGKTEKALDALKDLSSPRALVIRDGERRRIPGREVVKEDLIILMEGDRVPADGIVIWERNLSVDESLLTGESVPVRKIALDTEQQKVAMGRPGGEDIPFVYSGTMVVQGQGVVFIKETASSTEIGKIGKALQSVENEETLLQKETAKMVKVIFVIALILFLVVVVVYGITRHNWIEGILSGISLAMALLPEEFPVVLTVFLALGAWRISKQKVLTRKMTAVETLGAATVLCSDKTGTITQNKMSIKKIYANNSFFEVFENKKVSLPEDFHELIEYAVLASKRDPFDPMEKALNQLGTDTLSTTEHLHNNWNLVHEYPLSRELLALSHVWKSPDGNKFDIAAKGAPEAIMDLCHLPPKEMTLYSEKITLLAKEGLRILGVAKANLDLNKKLPQIQHDLEFRFLGLIGLHDPVRETVSDAVKLCYEAGIKVVMITGDYPQTAQNIAKQIGLKNVSDVITGNELEKMDLNLLKEKIKNIDIFARVVPEQKLILVDAFKANGEIVAMTGDGVNDAPALKSAHIGVAMGERGTDVAREASSLVLMNDDFSSIVAAIRMGRKIFDNLKKAMSYIVSVHIPIAGMSLIPVICRWPELVLLPVHIVFLELIIDPACSVVFEAEPEESDIMKRKPRKANEPIFGKKTLMICVLQGIVSLIIVFLVFKISLRLGHSWDSSRALCFVTLIISNLSLILTNRNWKCTILESHKIPNSALYWIFAGTIIFLSMVIFIPFLQKLFHFAPMHSIDMFLAGVAGVISILWFELVKYISNKKHIELLKEK